MKLIFIDTETTGLTEYDRLCQVAYKYDDVVVNELFQPPVPMNIEAMAVHHITTEMLSDKPFFKETTHYTTIKDLFSKKTNVFVAHNAPFDINMLKREDIDVKASIDTLKIARELLKDNKDVKKYNLQHLRYSLNINVKDAVAHDAFGDILVLEELFNHLFAIAREKADAKAAKTGRKAYTDDDIIKRFIEMTEAPGKPVTHITFGKHEGKTIQELVKVDRQYAEWIMNSKKGDSRDKDLYDTLNFYLNGAGKEKL